MDGYSITLLLFIGFVSAIFLFFKKRYAYWKDRGIPYLEPSIPFGNLAPKPVEPKEITHEFYRNKDKGPLVGGFIFAKPFLVVNDLDLIQNILIKDFGSFHERGMYWNERDDPLSAQLLFMDGEKWKMLRTKLTPTFTSGKMKFMFPIVVEVADRFNRILADSVDSTGVPLEMKDLLARFMTDVIGTCAFGIECNSLKDPNAEFRYYGRKIFEEPRYPLPIQFLIFLNPEISRKLRVKVFTDDVLKFFLDTVRETIEYREKNNVKRNDFMDLLIRLKNGESVGDDSAKGLDRLSFEDVAAQAFVFFIAGFETSSTTMTFTMYELALNPDLQERAREEIETVLSNHNGKLTYEAVKDMTYVDQIISETLRKYPAVVSINRKCGKTYRVPNTQYTIEEGTTIFIPTYWIHHDPEIYPDPEIFDPERFAPDQIKTRHPMAFLGFGEGPRNCIGLRFGRIQTQICLITLLRNYRFKTCTDTPIPIVFNKKTGLLAVEGGMPLQVEKI